MSIIIFTEFQKFYDQMTQYKTRKKSAGTHLMDTMQRRTAPVQFTPSPKKPMRASAFTQNQEGADQSEFSWGDHSLMQSALLHRHNSLLVAKRYFMGGGTNRTPIPIFHDSSPSSSDIIACAEFLKERGDQHLTGQFLAQAFSALQKAQ